MTLESDLDRISTWSFKEIDARHGCPKGTAFRAFKRLSGELKEGEDFYYLPAGESADLISQLKAAGRLYQATVHAVLLTDSGYARLRTALPPPVDHA